MTKRTGRARLLIGALVAVTGALSAFAVAAPGAAAQGGDPYGGTTTTTEAPAGELACSVNLARARVGSTVGGELTDARPGESHRILLGSELVAEVVATTPRTSFGFTVPDMRPGRYQVSAVGATASATCTVPGGGTSFQVLPRTGGNGDEADGAVLSGELTAGGESTAGGGARSGTLPFTGAHVAVLVLFGVALVALGLVLRNRARLRRAMSGV